MKTFFGFTTGLLGGVFIGMIFVNYAILTDDDVREFFNKSAEELKN